MKVIVTGGSGFIGTPVMQELTRRGHEPVPFDRRDGFDIMTDWPASHFDHVIHLAGMLGTHELFDQVNEAIDVNIKGAVNVLRWCYQFGAGYTGILMPDAFPSVYTATKIAAQRFAEIWHHEYKVPVSHVRAFNAFGEGQKYGPGHPQKIVPTFARAAWAGEPMPVWGDGTQLVDLIHTSDLARMLVDAMEYSDCEVFDGGTGTPYSVNEVAEMVLFVVKGDDLDGSEVVHLPMRRGEVPTAIAATGEGWDLLGWKPEFRMQDLADTVCWYGMSHS
jgi:nucleoside-diphosphate-sugar epimerase